MPFVAIGSVTGLDFIMSGAGGAIGPVTGPRPGVPDFGEIRHNVIRPPVGYVAYYNEPPPELVLEIEQTPFGGGVMIELVLDNELAPIYYTRNGEDPTDEETATNFLYTMAFALTVSPGDTFEIRAKAFAQGTSDFTDSPVVIANITLA